MKILVPIDETDRYRSILAFVEALKPPTVEIRFVHAITPISGYDGTFAAIAAANGDDLFTQRDAVAERLQTACDEATGMGFLASSEIVFGYPAEAIEWKADEFGAELIALAATPKQPIELLLSNCVSIELVENSFHNLLIIRGNPVVPSKFNAVFATDHSAIAEQCLDHLLKWKLEGIARVEVLTAYQILGQEEAISGETSAIRLFEVDEAIRTLLLIKTERAAAQFRETGIEAQARCLEIKADAAIQRALADTSAQLLILSARQHAFWKSLVGSTSVHETVTQATSLLILRPADCKRCPNRKSCDRHKGATAEVR